MTMLKVCRRGGWHGELPLGNWIFVYIQEGLSIFQGGCS